MNPHPKTNGNDDEREEEPFFDKTTNIFIRFPDSQNANH